MDFFKEMSAFSEFFVTADETALDEVFRFDEVEGSLFDRDDVMRSGDADVRHQIRCCDAPAVAEHGEICQHIDMQKSFRIEVFEHCLGCERHSLLEMPEPLFIVHGERSVRTGQNAVAAVTAVMEEQVEFLFSGIHGDGVF